MEQQARKRLSQRNICVKEGHILSYGIIKAFIIIQHDVLKIW